MKAPIKQEVDYTSLIKVYFASFGIWSLVLFLFFSLHFVLISSYVIDHYKYECYTSRPDYDLICVIKYWLITSFLYSVVVAAIYSIIYVSIFGLVTKAQGTLLLSIKYTKYIIGITLLFCLVAIVILSIVDLVEPSLFRGGYDESFGFAVLLGTMVGGLLGVVFGTILGTLKLNNEFKSN